MPENKEMRRFEPKMQDYLGTVINTEAFVKGEISEGEISSFCHGCDNLGEDNICQTAGSNGQSRYVARDWCGWAVVDGQRGHMTGNGFKSNLE